MDDARSLPRRSFLLGLGGALALSAVPKVARAGGKTVLILGGSTIHGALGEYLETSLGEAGLAATRHSRNSSGLARPDFYDWQAAARKHVARTSPDAVIVNFGGNDGQALFMGEGAKPKWIKWEEAGWTVEYRRRVDALADILASAGARIYWMGMPEMKSNELDGRMERMNGIFEAAMRARSDGEYISTRGLMPGVSGYAEFAKIGGKQVRVRAEDGVHYSIHGARIVAAAVVPAVTSGLLG